MVSINNDPRAVRESNKIGAKIYKLSGDWTGYGYETIDRYISRSTPDQRCNSLNTYTGPNPPAS